MSSRTNAVADCWLPLYDCSSHISQVLTLKFCMSIWAAQRPFLLASWLKVVCAISNTASYPNTKLPIFNFLIYKGLPFQILWKITKAMPPYYAICFLLSLAVLSSYS